jgi:exonuclease III
MAFLNVVSLPKKIDEIRYSMSSKNVDLIAFNETRLDSSISDNILHLNDYDIIRKDRSRSGGGVCIYLRSSINYHIRNDLIPTELEAVCIEIIKPHSKPFLVTTVYRPPNASADFFEHFENLIKAIDDENKEFYVLGDLNCDMLKTGKDENMPIKKIKSLYELYQLSQLIQEATRVTMTTSTLIDHIVANTPEKVSASGVIHTGISDHSLVFTIRKISVFKKLENTVEIRNMKKFDNQKFVEDLVQQQWENVYFFADTPNAKWEIWKMLFLEVLDKHAPLQHKRIRTRRVPWITSSIKELINTREKLKRKAIITNLENDWLNYQRTRNKVNIELRKAKKDYYSTKIAGDKSNPKEAWKTINSLLGRRNKPTIVNELKLGENSLTNPKDIAEGFNEYFSNIGPNLASQIDTSNSNYETYVKNAESEFTAFQPVTVNLVYKLLTGLSSNKATGVDKISCKIIKIASSAISDSLTHIFNQAITLSSFPDEWKTARVIPLYKNGQRNVAGNYRPISVLPAISKVMEKILYDQLYNYLSNFRLLSDSQFGFRKFHSTATALLDCTNDWYMNLDRKMFNLVVLIDLKKAFDTVDHQILLRKLELYGVKGQALSFLNSYLSNRSQKCQINGSLSSEKMIRCGVPQGSILGPLFFLLYINDLPQCLSKTKPRLFADDTNLTASGDSITRLEAAVNSDLENLRKWLIANKLSLNVAKTEFMLIGSKQMIKSISNWQPNVEIENKQIKQVHECKTLGVTVDQHLSWKSNTENICKKITSGISALRRLKDFVDRQTLLSVYNAIVRPYFDYCCEVWDVFSETQSKRLQKLQNRSARIIMNMSNDTDHSVALQALGWKTLKTERKKAKAKMMYKLLNSKGPQSLTDLFTYKGERTSYNLRNISSNLCLPQPRTNNLKKSLLYDGSFLWNSIPKEIRESKSLSSFKTKIAAHFDI